MTLRYVDWFCGAGGSTQGADCQQPDLFEGAS